MRQRELILVVAAILVAMTAAAADVERVHVLVANDDGINAPGLAALVAVLAADPTYRVTVVAPAEQQSGQGHALVIRGEIAVTPHPAIHGATAWTVAATPATAVKVGLTALLVDDPPDLVVSGINRGENVGRAAWYSGTVGAAREAVFEGLPAIAFSLQLDWTDPRPDYAAAARWSKPVVDAVRAHGLPDGVLLNVNFPADSAAARGYRLATMGLAPDEVSRYEVVRHDGEVRYVKSVWRPPVESTRGADTLLVDQGWVAVAPLGIDQTAARAFAVVDELGLSCLRPASAE